MSGISIRALVDIGELTKLFEALKTETLTPELLVKAIVEMGPAGQQRLYSLAIRQIHAWREIEQAQIGLGSTRSK